MQPKSNVSFPERYEVIRRLGEGAMGVVDLADDRVLDRLVALKRLMMPEHVTELEAVRVVQEARAAAKISHPGVATVYAVERDENGRTVLSMEYCSGESLKERLARKPIEQQEALRIGLQIAEALGAAHEQGVVHRDVKPANILLPEDGGVKLVDFGIAVAPADGSGRGYTAGTPGYMAPEQRLGPDVDARADLWALGAVLREMLATGEDGDGVVAAPLRRVLDRLTESDPTRRYQSAAAVVSDLGALVAGTGRWRVSEVLAVPAPLDGFVGRSSDLHRLRDTLRSSRLVTVVGPGGVGKTRLAMELVHDATFEPPPVVAFVELAPVRDPHQVLSAVAAALRVPVPAGVSVAEALRAALDEVEMLLILDNFEHVLDAAEDVLRLLQECRRTKILVTSRERLRLSAEREVPLDALPLEGPSGAEASSPAAELFRMRTTGLSTDGGTDSDEDAAVDRICRAVDGLPLGIELAARAIRSVRLSDAAEQLEGMSLLLDDDARDRAERHRTLEGVTRWSFELLDDADGEALLRVSVFVSPFTAEEAAGLLEEPVKDIGPRLERLAERNLLRRTGASESEPLFSFLETIRAFCVTERNRAPESGDLTARHHRFFAELTSEAAGNLSGASQVRWLNRLERSAGDLSAALHGSLEGGDRKTATRMIMDAWRFWLARGRSDEGRHMVVKLLSDPNGQTPDERARLLDILATFERNSGLEEEALAHLEESLAILRDLGEEARTINLLNQLSWSYVLRSELDVAESYARSALEDGTRLGAPRAVALGHNNLGWIANFRDQGSEGREHHEQSLAIVRGAGDARAVVYGLTNVAWSLLIEDEIDSAMDTLEQAREIWRDVRDPLMEGWVATVHGQALSAVGRTEEALDTLRRARSVGERFQIGAALAWALVALGEVERKSGRVLAADETLSEGLRVSQQSRNAWAYARCCVELDELATARDPAERSARLKEAEAIWQAIGNQVRLDRCRARLASIA